MYLKRLISSQNDLNHLADLHSDSTIIIPSLTQCRDMLKRLYLFVEFESQDVIFPNLQILRISNGCPKDDGFTRFLRNNGKNLIELEALNLGKGSKTSISQFCSNLEKFFTIFIHDELNMLAILEHCQRLESINIVKNFSR